MIKTGPLGLSQQEGDIYETMACGFDTISAM